MSQSLLGIILEMYVYSKGLSQVSNMCEIMSLWAIMVSIFESF